MLPRYPRAYHGNQQIARLKRKPVSGIDMG